MHHPRDARRKCLYLSIIEFLPTIQLLRSITAYTNQPEVGNQLLTDDRISKYAMAEVTCSLPIHKVGQKVGPLRLKARILCSHLLNESTSFYDFWHTSTPFYSTYTCRFKVHQIYQAKWRYLEKVNNSDFALTNT